ncbi:transposase [Methylacidiphilum fumariolicum]|uniref:Uncharacterized protein n=2 Tax=Candidatus Methylacidiphilum fumarolicum TaxID=591154 RepID=I0K1I7_METFB|nr:transposase [Candidatus Methylacidiphilum fumarolicum]CCG93356.1 hypothetical protein MFUM_990001 [Methylacidiphilum fumariolicum SolV]
MVFVPQYRCGMFPKEILEELRKFMNFVSQDFESEWLECDGEKTSGPFWGSIHPKGLYPCW